MKIRKLIMLLLSVVLLSVYMIIVDPFSNAGILEDIPYGIALLFLVKVFLLSVALITLLNSLTDLQVDDSHGNDERLYARMASKEPTGASVLMVSRGLIYVANALIILGVLIYSAPVQ